MQVWLIGLIIAIVVIVTIIVIGIVVVAIVVPLVVLKDEFPPESEVCPKCPPGQEKAYYIGYKDGQTDIDTLANLDANLGGPVELGNFGEPLFYTCETAFSNSVLLYKVVINGSLPNEQIDITNTVPLISMTNDEYLFTEKKHQDIVGPKLNKSNKKNISFTTKSTNKKLGATNTNEPIGYVYDPDIATNEMTEECCRLVPQLFNRLEGPQSQIYQFVQSNGSYNFEVGPNQPTENENFRGVIVGSAHPECFNEQYISPPLLI